MEPPGLSLGVHGIQTRCRARLEWAPLGLLCRFLCPTKYQGHHTDLLIDREVVR